MTGIAAGMLLSAGMLMGTAAGVVGAAAGTPADTGAMGAGALMPFMPGCCARVGAARPGAAIEAAAYGTEACGIAPEPC